MAQNATFEQQLFKQVLKARTLLMEVTGVILQRRTGRDMLRQGTSWQVKDISSSYRQVHSPKFSCCQCMEAFVMYADYEEHFLDGGLCGVLHERALFYPEYKRKGNWDKQLQLEHEVRRLNDEIPAVNYQSLVGTFRDISLSQNDGVRAMILNNIKRAQVIYLDKHEKGRTEQGKDLTMGEEMIEVVEMCGDGHLSPMVAMCVADCIGRPVPNEWVVEDKWDLGEFKEWIKEVVDNDIALKQPIGPSALLNKEKAKLDMDTWLLGTVYVRVVRLLQVAAESSLIALMENRTRRPRKLTMSDVELIKIDMEHLTKKAFDESRMTVIKKLKKANEAMERLATIFVPGCCDALTKKGSGQLQVRTSESEIDV